MINIKFPRLFRLKPEVRAETTENTSNASAESTLLTFFGITGELTREAAMEIPSVAACINKISETVSRLPVKLYKKDGEKVTEITDDSRLRLLNGETGDTLSTVDMWKSAIEDYFLGRGAWIYIDSDGLKVKGLHYVDSSKVSFMENHDPIFKAFHVLVNGQKYYDFSFLHFLRKTRDGYTNIPIQKEHATILSAVYNSLKLENAMSSNGGCKSGFLKSKNRLSREAIDSIKDGYETMYGNSESKKKFVVLNDGVEFQEISATAAELQMNENKRTNSVEICKIFGFPHTIIDGGASEEDKKQFISVVIALLNQIETALDCGLLLESEKGDGYYWAFDVKELTRGSVLERYQAYAIAKQNNILQVDEIRREEDYEPLGFNYMTLGLADVLLNPQTMEVFTPNTGQTTSLGEVRADNYKRDSLGRFAGNGGKGKSSKKRLTKKPVSVKIGKKERKLVVSEINTYYHKRYEGKSAGIYYSGTYGKAYKFNINGFDNYQFISAKKIK